MAEDHHLEDNVAFSDDENEISLDQKYIIFNQLKPIDKHQRNARRSPVFSSSLKHEEVSDSDMIDIRKPILRSKKSKVVFQSRGWPSSQTTMIDVYRSNITRSKIKQNMPPEEAFISANKICLRPNIIT